MSNAALDIHSRWFFDDIAAASERVLLLDYDGTFAPFCPDGDFAFPSPEIPDLLQQIVGTCRTRLILLTGRPARLFVPLLKLDPMPETWGSYGMERLYADGCHKRYEVTDDALDALAEAETGLQNEGLETQLEIRPGAVAVHWKGLTPSYVLDIRTKACKILNPLASRSGLLVADFDGGVELRVPTACTGDAVRTILSEIDANVPLAYLGDDTMDGDAFRVLNNRGLSVFVRPQYSFTAAQVWLRSPHDVIRFLREWIAACRECVTAKG